MGYDEVGFKGAFGNQQWMGGWSYLAVTNRLSTYEMNCVPGTAATPGIPIWGIILFIVVAALMVLVCIFVCIMISRERKQKPIFMPFETKSATATSTDKV